MILVLVLAIAIFAWKTGQRDGESKGEDNAQKLQQELEEWKAKYKEMEEHPVMVEPITPEISMSEIQQEIRQLGELATVEYFYTNAARFSDGKTLWGIRLSEKSFVLKWDGTIKAGIDVNEIGIEPQEESRVLTVKLPADRILSHDPDLDSVEALLDAWPEQVTTVSRAIAPPLPLHFHLAGAWLSSIFIAPSFGKE